MLNTNINIILKNILKLPRVYKILIVLIGDIFFSIISMYLALIVTIGFLNINVFSYYLSLIISVILFVPIFAKFGFYNAIFRYQGNQNIFNIFFGSFCYAFLFIILIYFSKINYISTSAAIIQPIFLLLFILISRILYSSLISYSTSTTGNNILIYGAGNLGVYASTVLLKYSVFGYIDDDINKIGKKINNKEIYKVDEIENIIKLNNIKIIIIAISNLNINQRRQIILSLQNYTIKTVFFPNFDKISNPDVRLKDLEKIKLEDLINRKIQINTSIIEPKIINKSIVVTGAGGSIGSELVKQILDMKPKCLILIDHNEYNLYTIAKFVENNLNIYFQKTYTYLTSVTNYNKIKKIFEQHKPDLVYHAAAYKHVPLAEKNINEYFNNNVIGTINLVNLSLDYNVKNFTFISTDKAVRPTNVMGATKRVAEIYIQSISEFYKTNTTIFSSIRFGNVLGSNGSVVPLFNEQIEKGGPITVTHPEVTRYFMTIGEAVGLVLSSIQISKGGEIFFLDMGKPIKIVDLAKKMINLSGLRIKDNNNPNGDIEIKYTGLRIGEKMHEELFMNNNPQTTQLPQIYMVKENFIPFKEFEKIYESSKEAIKTNNKDLILKILKSVVEGFN